MITLRGIPASEGIAIGRCHILDRSKVHVKKQTISDEEVVLEIRKLDDAVARTQEYISHVKTMSEETLGKDHAFIFDVYLLLLKDDMLIGETKRMIGNQLVNAEFALQMVKTKLVKIFNQASDEYFRERKNDVEHIVQKLFRFMTDKDFESVNTAEEGGIIIAHDFSPSDITYMVRRGIAGFVTDLGSYVSHTSILARSVGIPASVGMEDVTTKVTPGDEVIIDGFTGTVIINPTPEVLVEYRQKQQRYLGFTDELAKLADEAPVTLDGEQVHIYSNIELNDEIPMASKNGSEGIGLYRTEFIYLEHGDVSEERQYDILKEAILAIGPDKPIVIRTFDLGGEKLSNLMPHPDERNPVMGLRAIRYSLRFQSFFMKQLKAIARAGVYGDVRIMFPMISGLAEFHEVREALRAAYDELKEEGVPHRDDLPLGVMVELPSLALSLELIAPEVSFFSVGTNDLIQYTIGIDRNNEYVAYLYRPTHPGVLFLLKNIVRVADSFGVEATVCGEMAGDARYIPVLIGMGYRKLSMSPAGILKAKMIIKRLDSAECRTLVERLGRCTDATSAEALLQSFITERASEVFFH